MNQQRQFNLPVLGDRTYVNPVPFISGQHHTSPDPFILTYRGQFYCYATHVDGVQVSISTDLVSWEHSGWALEIPGRKSFWAPSVIHSNGVFYMYTSTVPEGSTDPHDGYMQLSTSTSPTGPFEYQKTFFDKFSIDSQIVRDKDGQYYLFYSTNDTTGLNPENPGTSILIDRMIDFYTLANEPQTIVIPTLDQEVFEHNRFGDGRDWHTIEGATYFTHKNAGYLTYSGNAYVREDYFVSYSTASTLGKTLGEMQWTKYPSNYEYHALIQRNSHVEGTGHNSVTYAPNLVDPWLVYHGRNADEELTLETEQRTMRIDPLFFDGPRLTTNAPSHLTQDAPGLPNIQLDFNAASTTATQAFADTAESTLMHTISGSFNVGDRQIVSAPDYEFGVLASTTKYENYVASIDLRANFTHAGARFGFYPRFVDLTNCTEVLFDSGQDSVILSEIVNNFKTEIARASISGFDMRKFQNLRVTKQFGQLELELEGKLLLSTATTAGPGHVGLGSRFTEAAFSALRLTEHTFLYGQSLREISNFYTGLGPIPVSDRGVGMGYLRQISMGADELKEHSTYTFDFDFYSSQSTVDYYPAYQDEDNYVRVTAHQSGLEITQSSAGRVEALLQLDQCPTQFSLRLTKLDGQLVLRALNTTVKATQPTGHVSQMLNLLGSILTGFSVTSHAGNFPSKKKEK